MNCVVENIMCIKDVKHTKFIPNDLNIQEFVDGDC